MVIASGSRAVERLLGAGDQEWAAKKVPVVKKHASLYPDHEPIGVISWGDHGFDDLWYRDCVEYAWVSPMYRTVLVPPL